MKLVACLVFAATFSAWAAPCGGEPAARWTNPDGTLGGWIGKDTKVAVGVYIAPSAEACEFVQIQSGARILENSTVGGRAVIGSKSEIGGSARIAGEAKIGGGGSTTRISENAKVDGSSVITGKTHIYGRSSVSGSSKVHNSQVCQASIIKSIQVIDSDYYCQTEDPEPLPPGILGQKTLLGVDADRDGVRDDLEIWINDYFSNTSEKNYRVQRLEFKQFSRESNEVIKHSKDKAKVIALQNSKDQSIECFFQTLDMSVVNEAQKLHQAFLLNTKERRETYMKAQMHLAGQDTAFSLSKVSRCRYK